MLPVGLHLSLDIIGGPFQLQERLASVGRQRVLRLVRILALGSNSIATLYRLVHLPSAWQRHPSGTQSDNIVILMFSAILEPRYTDL